MTGDRLKGLFVALFLLPGLVLARPNDNHRGTGYDPKRDPAADLKDAFAVARTEHKKILMVVGGNWCGSCQALAETLHDEGIAREIAAHFVLIKVNFSPQNENLAFLSHYPEITGYPHLLILDANGSLLFTDDMDAFESGDGYDCTKLMAFLHRWERSKSASRGSR